MKGEPKPTRITGQKGGEGGLEKERLRDIETAEKERWFWLGYKFGKEGKESDDLSLLRVCVDLHL